MNKLIIIPWILLLLLSSCKHVDSKNNVPALTSPPAKQSATPKAYKPFTKDTLNILLLAEFAEHRGLFELALNNYVSQANKTKDPYVIERAYQIAQYLNSNPQQLDMALLWVSKAPDNIEANRAAALELTKNERSQEASRYFLKVLTNTDQLDFLNIANNNLTKKARQYVIDSLNNLLTSHPNNAQLIYSKTVLLAENGAKEQALTTLQTLPRAQQQQSAIILLKVYLLQNIGKPEQALNFLGRHIKNDSTNKELRLTYIQQLISQGKLVEAKQQFAQLIKQFPEEEELRYGYALICIENKEWDEAINNLKQLIDEGIDSDNIYFYLAGAYDSKGDKDSAFYNYSLVKDGENQPLAIINSAKILFDKKKLVEASQLLTAARKQNPEYATPFYLFEIDELINHNSIKQAWQLVSKALADQPHNTGLIYGRALVAEKLNNVRQAEQDLRQVIKLEPNNATALNALGYILADKTSRYKEALALIQQALKIEPDNPLTLDSLGWVNYKLGNLGAAASTLQQAYAKRPDPEIAAHLGEILWQQGQQQQAKIIWSKALEENPTNETLSETIFRLTGNKDL